MSKKYRFLISASLLSIGFVVIQLLDSGFRFYSISALVILTGIFCVWSLYEGLDKNTIWISLILPMLFTLSVGVFWFLLPTSIFTRIPVFIFYALGIYILFSTMNIYIVSSSVKTIGLLRAARGVGFVLTLIVSFLVFDAIFSLRQGVLVNMLASFIFSFLMFIQGFWSIVLSKKIDKNCLTLSLVSSLIITEMAALIFFWPVTVIVGSLFLTCGIYVLLGLGQANIEDRLFPTVAKEYLTLGFIVILGVFFATKWGG